MWLPMAPWLLCALAAGPPGPPLRHVPICSTSRFRSQGKERSRRAFFIITGLRYLEHIRRVLTGSLDKFETTPSLSHLWKVHDGSQSRDFAGVIAREPRDGREPSPVGHRALRCAPPRVTSWGGCCAVVSWAKLKTELLSQQVSKLLANPNFLLTKSSQPVLSSLLVLSGRRVAYRSFARRRCHQGKGAYPFQAWLVTPRAHRKLSY